MDAVLVELKFGGFGNSKKDKTRTEEVKRQHGQSGKPVGNWTKNLLPPGAFTQIAKGRTKARSDHDMLTLKWGRSCGLLAEAGRQTYIDRMSQNRDDDAVAVQRFLRDYKDEDGKFGKWMVEAQLMHGPLFDPMQYPSLSEMRALFSFSWYIFPVPEASHFSDRLRDIYAGDMTAEVNRRVAEATEEMWTRLLVPVQYMASRLANPDAVFRDTLVTNVREILQIAPAINLTNDSRINDAVAEIERQLTGLDVETLRTDKVARSNASNAAATIIGRFGSFASRKILADTAEAASHVRATLDENGHPKKRGGRRKKQAESQAGVGEPDDEPMDGAGQHDAEPDDESGTSNINETEEPE